MPEDDARERDGRWFRRVDNALDLEPTNRELRSKRAGLGFCSALHTRGKAFTWGLLGAVILFMGGILLIILVGWALILRTSRCCQKLLSMNIP